MGTLRDHNPSPEVKLKGRAVSIVSNFLKDDWMVINYMIKQPWFEANAKKRIENGDPSIKSRHSSESLGEHVQPLPGGKVMV
jgi:hypothetical protein